MYSVCNFYSRSCVRIETESFVVFIAKLCIVVNEGASGALQCEFLCNGSLRTCIVPNFTVVISGE